MFDISKNGVISISRGDDASFVLFINAGTLVHPSVYVLQQNDFVYFGIMEANQTFEDGIVRKKIDKDKVTEDHFVEINLHSEDTVNLRPGKYFYTIKLLRASGLIDTLIPQTEFYVTE